MTAGAGGPVAALAGAGGPATEARGALAGGVSGCEFGSGAVDPVGASGLEADGEFGVRSLGVLLGPIESVFHFSDYVR